jgi:hypothetical protein
MPTGSVGQCTAQYGTCAPILPLIAPKIINLWSIPSPLCGVDSAQEGYLGSDLLRNNWLWFLREQF